MMFTDDLWYSWEYIGGGYLQLQKIRFCQMPPDVLHLIRKRFSESIDLNFCADESLLERIREYKLDSLMIVID